MKKFPAKTVSWLSAAMLAAAVLFSVSTVFAVATISRGYITDDSELQLGMVASLNEDISQSEQKVERASSSSKDKVVGIVSTIDDSLVTLTDSSAKVYIATAGEVSAFVSDIGGPVKRGDFLAVSPVKGVLMRSTSTNNKAVVGLALDDAPTTDVKVSQIQDANGIERDVNIVKVPMEITQRVIAADNNKENILRIFGESLTGKTVTPLQVLVALIIFFIVLIVEGSIIYGAVYSSFISLGRNPLGKRAIYRQMAQVSLLAVLVLTIGLGAVYAVLWV